MTGPVRYPRNILTDAIEANKAGRLTEPVAPVSIPLGMPTVRSADLGTIVPGLPPLTPEEKAELDAKADALGIHPDGSQGPPLTDAQEEHLGTYASDADVAAELLTAAHAPDDGFRGTALQAVQTGRMSGRMPNITPPPGRGVFVKMTPVLPDFKAVESVDFISHHMHVGGMMFPMEPAFEAALRRQVMQAVVAEVQARLAVALEAEDSIAGTTGEPSTD